MAERETAGRAPAQPADETAAFERLVRRHAAGLLGYALALAPGEADAEDLVQEALLVAYRKQPAFDTPAGEGRWLRGVVRRKYLEQRRARRERPMEAGLLDAIGRTHESWGRAAAEGRGDALSTLRECLARLAGPVRQAVELFYLRGLPGAAVARETGSGEPAVRKRLERARAELARCVRRKLALER